MKKVLFTALLSFLFVSAVFAGPFQPAQLKFSGPSSIHYDFNGTDLDIPITLTGMHATAIFSVFTKGQGENILDIQNGRLGWHYVNRIDTCVYVSSALQFDPGHLTLSWDGTTTDGGGQVPSGDYTYYVWGYDDVSQKTQVAKYIGYEWMDANVIISKDEQGNPLAQPIIYDCPDSESYNSGSYLPYTNRYTKWVIGGDPSDSSLIESTYLSLACSMYEYAVDPDDNSLIYVADTDHVSMQWVSKYSWVPNDFATQDYNWGTDGKYTYATDGGGQEHYFLPGVYDIGGGEIVMPQRNGTSLSRLAYIDKVTGELTRTMSLEKYYLWTWIGTDGSTESRNITPTLCDLVNGRMFLNEPYTFKLTVVDPYATEMEDFYLWHNGPGDGYHDHYSGHPDWTSSSVRQYSYRGGQDSNGHVITSAYDLGAVSFDMQLPDGTGAGYFNFSGESSGPKNGIEYIDYGSAYDGMYMDNGSGTGGTGTTTGWWYMASDSISGTITSAILVENDAPSAFTVAQNSPNPFNPTTTLNFNIAKPGKVTVDIYNVAGQKVDTLVNGNMSAGSHSVVWNASKFSAGVYFYTVKSGSFSKTMKMTLVK